MAVYYARKSGNVNATDVWATTPTGTAGDFFPSFTSADTLVLNGFSPTLNVSMTVGEIRSDSTGGATPGGVLYLFTPGLTLTANFNSTGNTANGMLQSGAVSSFTLVGNITGGPGNCLRWQGNGATVNIIGSITGGTGGNALHLDCSSATINITGAVAGGPGGQGIGTLSSGNIINITGNVTGGTTTAGVSVGNNTVNITGNVTGGSASGASGLSVGTAGGSATVIGTVTGNGAAGAVVAATGASLTATRAKGAASGSAVGVSHTGGTVTLDEIEYGDLGASPVSGAIRFSDKPTNVAIMYRFGTTKKTLVDANASGLMPTASNVRFGVVYNGGNSTGTMAVPAAGSVALGVPVDNTTGTAALTPAAVWNYATASATTAGSMGERLRNAATVASTGQQLSDALSN